MPDMATFVREVLAARKEEFVEISLVNGELPSLVTLDSAAIKAAEARILGRYRVPRSCSSHYEHLVLGEEEVKK